MRSDTFIKNKARHINFGLKQLSKSFINKAQYKAKFNLYALLCIS